MALIKIPAVKSADYPQKPGYCLFKGTFKFTPIPFAVRRPSICRGFISAGCDFRLYRHLSRTPVVFFSSVWASTAFPFHIIRTRKVAREPQNRILACPPNRKSSPPRSLPRLFTCPLPTTAARGAGVSEDNTALKSGVSSSLQPF